MGLGASTIMRYKNRGTVLAPHFRISMNGKIDPRLPEDEQGLGVYKK
jgi:hypothetical protein